LKPTQPQNPPPPRKAKDSPTAAALLGALLLQIGNEEADESQRARGRSLLQTAKDNPAAKTAKFQRAIKKAAKVLARKPGQK